LYKFIYPHYRNKTQKDLCQIWQRSC